MLAPKLAVDPSGTVHLAFAQTGGDPFDKAEVLYTRSRDGKTFEPPRVISQPLTAGTGAAFPSLAVEGGRVCVTWDYYPAERSSWSTARCAPARAAVCGSCAACSPRAER